jgi:hypothetical protein
MIIDGNMNLDQLAERMGDVATKEDARAMRGILIEQGHWNKDTGDIEEAEWHYCLEAAVRFAAEDAAPDHQ